MGTVAPDEDRAKALTVAVTGPTGTFGFGLVPLLEADERVERVVGIARRAFDPAEHGWSKLEYRRGDVRDRDALEAAFAGADVVVHLAFMITGTRGAHTIRAINVDGTLNAFRAAAAAGATAVRVRVFGRGVRVPRRQPVPAHGGLAGAARRRTCSTHRRRPRSSTCSRRRRSSTHELGLYVLRPPVVLGPHAVGAKDLLPGPLAPLARGLTALVRRLPVPVPVAAPDLPLQFVDEEDVGQALLLSVVGAGPPGAYNLAGDGVLSVHDVAARAGSPAAPRAPTSGAGGRSRTGGPAVRAALRRVGGSDHPPLDHGHDQGPPRPRLATPLQRPGHPAPNASFK